MSDLGNERADKLVKEGAKKIQQEQIITFHEKKALIKAIRKVYQ
jgi:hypothetical protein